MECISIKNDETTDADVTGSPTMGSIRVHRTQTNFPAIPPVIAKDVSAD